MSAVTAPRGRVGYAAVFGLATLAALGWLALGGVAALLRYWPGLLDPAAVTGGFQSVLVAAAQATAPPAQLAVDGVLSLLEIGIAVALAVVTTRSWSGRLLALGLVGSAGAFNLQSDAVATVLSRQTGVPLDVIGGIALHSVAVVAFIAALLLFPVPDPAAWMQERSATPRGRVELAAVGGLLVVVGVSAPVLPCAVSCVLYLGFVLPALGTAVLLRMVRRGSTFGLRSQARLLLAVLIAALTTNLVLGIATLALWVLGVPGLALAGADAGAGPLAPLFWSARGWALAIAAVMLLTVLMTRLWGAERLVGRGLAAVLTTVVAGGVAVGVEAVGWSLRLSPVLSSLIAAAVAGVVFLPVRLMAEGLTDRLLYGVRPTPYRVLADIAKLAPSSTAAGLDLSDVARSVGNALDAEECRITVVRHSLSDRTYRWSRSGTDEAPALLSVPIRHGDEQIGTLAVEHAAVVGMHADRRQLLEDIAGVLGTVVEAHRIGIELERQLRAAVAHSAEIASSRRTAVSEMDAERRRIERDLHDGVQHYLVSGRLALGLVEFDAKSGRTESAVQRLDMLAGQLEAAERVLTETVGGVRSMLLTDHGLAVALDLELAGAASPVAITADIAPGRRYPPDVESAVFLCCLESVNNAVKHAAGAPVTVRIAEAGGTLRFTISDSGPGFVPPAGADRSSGRGLRNVRRRITDVGGWLNLTSEPGRGTTVDGVVPVPPHEAAAAPADHDGAGGSITSVQRIVGPGSRANLPGISVVAQRDGQAAPQPGTDGEEQTVRHADLPRVPLDDEETEHLPRGFAGGRTAPQPGRSLVAEARSLIAAVRVAVDPTAVLELVAIESALHDPLRVGFLGPPGADMTVLMRAVLPSGPTPDVEPVAVTDAHLPGIDALVVVAGGRGTANPGVPTIVVAEPGPGLDSDPLTSVQVRWRMASAAPLLTEAELAALRAGRPVPQLPPADHRVAVASAREARTLADFRADLIGRSGVPVLRTVLQQRVFARADLLRCQRALRGLSAMAPRLRPDDARHRLSYELERLVAARHELAESALLDALRSGDAQLKGPDRSAALRLLGAAGTSVTDRLGLPVAAAPRDVAFAARAELARWQRIAANPIDPGARHRAASVLIRTCEQILAHPLVAATARPAPRRTGAQVG